MLRLLLVILILLSPILVSAEEVTVKVKGMVCSFCAQGVKKTFGKTEGVEEVTVDLETKIVALKLKEGTELSDEEISKLINDAGYDIESITRETNVTEIP